MLSKAYFSLLTIFCKIGYMFCPSQFYIFFLGRVANVCSVSGVPSAETVFPTDSTLKFSLVLGVPWNNPITIRPNFFYFDQRNNNERLD
jgi:hypothetical protein